MVNTGHIMVLNHPHGLVAIVSCMFVFSIVRGVGCSRTVRSNVLSVLQVPVSTMMPQQICCVHNSHTLTNILWWGGSMPFNHCGTLLLTIVLLHPYPVIYT